MFRPISDEIPIAVQEVCDSANGTLRGGSYNRQCYLDDKLQTAEACFEGALCDSTRFDDNRCSRSYCLHSAVNSVNCSEANGNWENRLGVNGSCILSLDYQDCAGEEKTWVSGRHYNPGHYDTELTCPEETCNLHRSDSKNTTECLNTFQCTQPCSRCRTWSYEGII